MTNKTNGGAAFPRPLSAFNQHFRSAQEGMSLRDYFAAHSGVTWSDAVTVATEGGMVVRTGPEIAKMLAVMRYRVADEMLAKRGAA